MRYIYHYASMYQNSLGLVNHIDGIARLDSPIESMEGYRELKKLIDRKNHEKLTIVSLSLLKEAP